ncbi:MAG TPA: response regulator, partial [Vicinamibacteria bacterium]|nr:response regulator [Vicinamibacteria bacterium]
MSAPLKILHLEDNPHDAEIVRATLAEAGIECEIAVATSEREFLAGLPGADLVLSDYTLPGFSGLSALEAARRLRPEAPFLFVSGTIGEEAAVGGLLSGAIDYVFKHNLKRLAPSVRRAAREAAERRERRRAEEELRRSEERYRSLADHFRIALKHSAVKVSKQDRELRYTWQHDPEGDPEAVLGRRDEDLQPPEAAARLQAIKRRVLETGAP